MKVRESAVDHDACNNTDTADTISLCSNGLYFSHDHSRTSLLQDHGIQIREFIVLSFISDQGPMRVTQLARLVSMDPIAVSRSVERLSAAGLVRRNLDGIYADIDAIVILTDRGQDLADRIDE